MGKKVSSEEISYSSSIPRISLENRRLQITVIAKE
jgi:hypothetical protein